MQIISGSVLLLLCSVIHLGLLITTASFMRWISAHFPNTHLRRHWGFATAVAFAAVVVAHTIQVWLWAAAFIALDALALFSDALYFALVTYTTVGYGDVTVGEGFRLFAAMAAVTGLLNFGLSTAFLVGLMSKLLPIDGSRR